MSKRVIDKASQQEVEVSSQEAQEAVLGGDAALMEPSQTVVKGDQVMDLPTDKLADAIGMGWRLADEDEANATILRREETDIGSSLLGGAEAALAGATLGGSTWLADQLGGDPERMRARREALGGFGTALEVGGAIAPTLFTGGGAAAAQAGAGATRLGLGARALGAASNLSTRGVARLGQAAERGLVGAVGEGAGLVRTAVPLAGRGMVEGFAAGVGQSIDESVLGERPITAERLLMDGSMGALLGGGAGAIIPGISAAGSGLVDVGVRPMRQLLGRLGGMADDVGDEGLARILARKALGDRGSMQRRTFAEAHGLDLGDVEDIADDLLDPERAADLHRYMTQGNAVTEDLASQLRPVVEDFRNARRIAVTESSGAGRLRDVERHIPSDADALARIPQRAAKEIESARGLIERELAAVDGQLSGVSRIDLNRANVMLRQAETTIAAQARRTATGKAGARELAAVSHNAIDELKQGLDAIRSRYSGAALTPESRDSMDFLRRVTDPLRSHLEDVAVYGDAGSRQAARNLLMKRAIDAQDVTRGSASGRLLDRRRLVDNADLVSTVRNSGRFVGATKTEAFEDAIAAEGDFLEWASKNLDLDDATRAQIAEQVSAGKRVSEIFEKQRTKVRKLDILERWRSMEGNRSPSIGMLSTAGPAVLGAVGLGLGGPVGGAIGALFGMLTKPYTLTRKAAAILGRASRADLATTKAIGGMLARVGGRTAKALGTAGAAAGAVASAAGRRGIPLMGVEEISKVREDALRLARNPGLLADRMRQMTLDVEDEAPRLAAELARKAGVAVQYLATHAPPAYSPPLSKTPPLIEPIAAEQYARRIEAVRTPVVTLRRISDGTLAPEHIDALKNVWPEIYDDAKNKIFAALARRDEPLPLDAATQLSALWEAPVDPTLQFAPSIQAAFAGGRAVQAQQSAPGGGGKPIEIDTARYDTAAASREKAAHA